MVFPRQTSLWDMCSTQADHCLSDLCLGCGDWEGLHDSPSWLRLDLHLLTEGHPNSCLGGWLRPGLDPAKARNREDTRFLHFCSGKGCQAFKQPRANLCLHLMLLSKHLDEGSFCHGLATSLLHGLHGSHCYVNKTDRRRTLEL